MKRRGWILISSSMAIAGLVIWASSRSTIPKIDAETAERLAQHCNELCVAFPDRHVPESEWPGHIRKLRPRSVRTASEGVYIQLVTRFAESRGLFVHRIGSAFEPIPDGDPSFRLLHGRVYWYQIKG